jgi:hypothetical protein
LPGPTLVTKNVMLFGPGSDGCIPAQPTSVIVTPAAASNVLGIFCIESS